MKYDPFSIFRLAVLKDACCIITDHKQHHPEFQITGYEKGVDPNQIIWFYRHSSHLMD